MASIDRKTLLRAALGAIFLSAAGGALAQAADWPSRPVRVLVGYPAGGANDLVARAVSARLSDSLKQPFVVENKPGANSLIGAEAVAKSTPDGYTVLYGSPGSLAINPALQPNMPYDVMRDFAPVTQVLRSPVVAAGAELPTEFTGDGAGISPPLEWSGAPANTRAFAVIMHHLDPAGRTKWYWTLYNIPAEQRALPANAHDIGVLGSNGINRRVGYAPPHSKGPGAKSYTLTLYALSAPLQIEIERASCRERG